MSVHLTSIAWKTPGLSVVQKITLVKLADTAGDDGKCWPSITTVARECGCTERAIYTALDALEKMGHISRKKRTGTSSIYHIHPCTTFTPEYSSPLNDVHTPPERGSPLPCTTFIPPLNDVQANRKGTVKNRKGTVKGELVKLPFDSPLFAETVEAFRKHRKEIGKPLKPTGEGRLMKQLERMGESAAIAGMESSMASGWIGVFAPKPENGQKQGFKPAHHKDAEGFSSMDELKAHLKTVGADF